MSNRFDSIKPTNIFKQKSKKPRSAKSSDRHTPFRTKKSETQTNDKLNTDIKSVPNFELNNKLFPSIGNCDVSSNMSKLATSDVYIKQKTIRNNPEYNKANNKDLNDKKLEEIETDNWLVYKKINGNWFKSVDVDVDVDVDDIPTESCNSNQSNNYNEYNQNDTANEIAEMNNAEYNDFILTKMTQLVNRWEREEQQKRDLYGPDYTAIYPWEDENENDN